MNYRLGTGKPRNPLLLQATLARTILLTTSQSMIQTVNPRTVTERPALTHRSVMIHQTLVQTVTLKVLHPLLVLQTATTGLHRRALKPPMLMMTTASLHNRMWVVAQPIRKVQTCNLVLVREQQMDHPPACKPVRLPDRAAQTPILSTRSLVQLVRRGTVPLVLVVTQMRNLCQIRFPPQVQEAIKIVRNNPQPAHPRHPTQQILAAVLTPILDLKQHQLQHQHQLQRQLRLQLRLQRQLQLQRQHRLQPRLRHRYQRLRPRRMAQAQAVLTSIAQTIPLLAHRQTMEVVAIPVATVVAMKATTTVTTEEMGHRQGTGLQPRLCLLMIPQRVQEGKMVVFLNLPGTPLLGVQIVALRLRRTRICRDPEFLQQEQVPRAV